MNTSDAVLSFLPATETIAVANEIVKRIGRLNDDVTATMVFAEYDAFRRERATPRQPQNTTSDERAAKHVEHIIGRIEPESFLTITQRRHRKPTIWMHRARFIPERVIVHNRKGIIAQADMTDEQQRSYVAGLISRHLANGARVDLGVPL